MTINSSKANSRRKQWAWLAAFGVALLALALRLFFIFEESTVFLVWDASIYWEAAQNTRNIICDATGLCTPTADLPTGAGYIAALIYGREGLMPVLMGALMTAFPAQLTTAYVIQAVMDALICLMLMHSALRLGVSGWIAALGGLLFAIYIPAITGTGMLLQQPFIRFTLVLVIWLYALAFTARQFAWGYALPGAVASFLLGFSSITTRPLIWVIVIGVIILCMLDWRSLQRVLWGHLAGVIIVAGLMGMLVITASPNDGDVLARVLTGLSTSGTTQEQTTVLSFEHFWAPSSWQTVVDNPTESLFGDFARAPGEFSARLAFSLFGNFRYADYAFFQAFVLPPSGQNVQHMLLMLTGLLGLAWLTGSIRQSSRRSIVLLVLVVGGVLSLIYSMVSIEPRRVSVMMPFLALGVALFVHSLLTSRWRVYDVVIIAVVIGLWVLPVRLIRFEPEATYFILVTLRALAALGFVALLVHRWGQHEAGFVQWPPALALSSVILLVFAAQLQDSTWREWSRPIDGTIEQRVMNFQQAGHLHNWLIIDVQNAEQAAIIEIRLDGGVVKPAGQPMRLWEVGNPALWSPYGTLFDIANYNVQRRMWFAVPLVQRDFREATIAVSGEGRIYGDLHAGGYTYTGPMHSPWYTGHSLWRWQWNSTDPRIPAQQYLNATYRGTDEGLYRMFITQAAFGMNTNAFGAPAANDEETGCIDDPAVYMAPGNTDFYACSNALGNIEFFQRNSLLGVTDSDLSNENQPENTMIERIMTEQGGQIDVIQVMRRVFVANLYDEQGTLVYSLMFEI